MQDLSRDSVIRSLASFPTQRFKYAKGGVRLGPETAIYLYQERTAHRLKKNLTTTCSDEAQNKKRNAGSDVAGSYKVRAYRRDTLANVKSGLGLWGQTRSVSGALQQSTELELDTEM